MGGRTSGCQMKTPLSPGQNKAPFFFLLKDKGRIQVARFTLNYTASLRPNDYKSKTSIYRRSMQIRKLYLFSYSSFSSIFLFPYTLQYFFLYFFRKIAFKLFYNDSVKQFCFIFIIIPIFSLFFFSFLIYCIWQVIILCN